MVGTGVAVWLVLQLAVERVAMGDIVAEGESEVVEVPVGVRGRETVAVALPGLGVLEAVGVMVAESVASGERVSDRVQEPVLVWLWELETDRGRDEEAVEVGERDPVLAGLQVSDAETLQVALRLTESGERVSVWEQVRLEVGTAVVVNDHVPVPLGVGVGVGVREEDGVRSGDPDSVKEQVPEQVKVRVGLRVGVDVGLRDHVHVGVVEGLGEGALGLTVRERGEPVAVRCGVVVRETDPLKVSLCGTVEVLDSVELGVREVGVRVAVSESVHEADAAVRVERVWVGDAERDAVSVCENVGVSVTVGWEMVMLELRDLERLTEYEGVDTSEGE